MAEEVHSEAAQSQESHSRQPEYEDQLQQVSESVDSPERIQFNAEEAEEQSECRAE